MHLHKHLLSLQVHDVNIEVHPSFQMHTCEVADNNNNNVCPTFDFVTVGLLSNFILTFLYFFENAPILTPFLMHIKTHIDINFHHPPLWINTYQKIMLISDHLMKSYDSLYILHQGWFGFWDSTLHCLSECFPLRKKLFYRTVTSNWFWSSNFLSQFEMTGSINIIWAHPTLLWKGAMGNIYILI